jgi:hypothetical protein
MQVSKYRTADALIQELHDEGHDVIYERTTEYPVLKGVAQIPPAKHLLTQEGYVVGSSLNLWEDGADVKAMTASVMNRVLKTTLSRLSTMLMRPGK